MNWQNSSLEQLLSFIKNDDLRFLVKYTILFTLLFSALAGMALLRVISTEVNPFFYANF
jgi:hypothetical protein